MDSALVAPNKLPPDLPSKWYFLPLSALDLRDGSSWIFQILVGTMSNGVGIEMVLFPPLVVVVLRVNSGIDGGRSNLRDQCDVPLIMFAATMRLWLPFLPLGCPLMRQIVCWRFMILPQCSGVLSDAVVKLAEVSFKRWFAFDFWSVQDFYDCIFFYRALV